MWSLARRPRWIGMLALALALAAGFALLGQWQLERSIATGTPLQRDTETVEPLAGIAKPHAPVGGVANGQRASTEGSWVPTDYVVLSDRLNGGEKGYWVVGHLATDDGGSDSIGLAVALGWTKTAAGARAAIAELRQADPAPVEVTGRYLGGEDPSTSDFEHGKLSSIAASSLINIWHTVDAGGVYAGYLVSHDAVAGLERIDSPKPSTDVSPNWLNLFYAAEWVVFAGFALFLWYRLVRDAWEREQEAAAEAARQPTASAS
jgi:surfeit locus 1 family protein